jgi:pyruvate-formate lyase-activating enzyme
MATEQRPSRPKYQYYALRRLSRWERWLYWANSVEERWRLQLLGILKTVVARAMGRRFSCRALAARSNYNIGVNADLSVSCNCYDTRGRGRLGSLEEASFAEILNGPIALAMKRRLAEGVLAIPECAGCSELETTRKRDAEADSSRPIVRLQGVMLETIGACNLTCIGCTRPERPLARARIDVSKLDKIGAEFAALSVKDIFFFSLGEPFLSRSIADEVAALRRHLPQARIVVSTNGVHLDTDEKRRAAMNMDKVVVSLFGDRTETARRYQVGTDYERVVRNLRALTECTRGRADAPQIIWKYVVFNWNDRAAQIRKAVTDAENAGVDQIKFVFTTRPAFGISWRFFLHRHFRKLQREGGRQRVVNFVRRQSPPDSQNMPSAKSHS